MLIFGHGEHAEFHCRIFGVIAGHQFLLAFGKIERQSGAFGTARDHEHDEGQRLHGEPPPAGFGLPLDDRFHPQRTREQQDTNHRKPQRDFVADQLRARAQAPQKAVLVVRRPAPQHHAVDPQATDREDEQQANVQSGGDRQYDGLAPIPGNHVTEGNRGEGHRGGRQDRNRRDQEQGLVGPRGNNFFLEDKFQAVCQRLQQAPGPDAIGPQPVLNVGGDLALDEHEVCHCPLQDEHQEDDLNQRFKPKLHSRSR